MRRDTVRADMLLLLVAAIWGSGFVAQREASAAMGPLTFNSLRYLIGFMLVLPAVMLFGTLRPTRSELRGGIVLGLVMTAAAWLQQAGIETTTASRAGFLTGLYVLIVPPIARLVGQRIVTGHVVGAVLAVVGLWQLSGDMSGGMRVGDQLVLACAFLWAAHVVLIGHLAARADALRLAAVQFGVVALTSGAIALLFERDRFETVPQAMLPVCYSGVFVIAIAFTLQIVAQKRAPASHAAVLMSLEAVFGAVFGVLLLSERLGRAEIIGCSLMLAGCLVSQLWPHRRSPAEEAELTDPVR